MTPKELFAIIDKRWKWVAKDDEGVWLFTRAPINNEHAWDWTGGEVREITDVFTIDFGTDDWTKCIARRDEIDMDEIRRVYEAEFDERPYHLNKMSGLTAVVEYVRNQLEQGGKE